ncbi:precorrin-3 methyltransferase [Methanothermus fervidus DSM 2088]|uniref:Precorrin-3 methyltransferase n=1 Tax=Methanothermus fervidus (strain ATCC 43054 / DSM 2088 / JCM 10308 / V24 S) TaxID=523846 RepID=E3GWQ2_METFV|nr:precorrin-3B C(17)-methyltransferase [Methanothermus fervidus]ADP77971.1 precorrin-3 methyltransferase [Methanothermus fervidus DSM 2088]
MIRIVGIGPSREDITLRALKALKKSDVVIGYKKYIEMIKDLVKGKEVIVKGMGDEIERAELAIQKHYEGKDVALISSGDPGVYGMANVLFQLIGKYSDLEIEVIPGVTAATYAASKVGAPLHDFAVISLSDILTPVYEIKEKIKHAAKSHMIIVLYNPSSKKRKKLFFEVCDLLLKYLKPDTPVGIVRNEKKKITKLENLKNEKIDMSTTVIIGNKLTYIENNYMITPRGYVIKQPINELARDYYKRYLEGKIQKGPNLECEYYPCHFPYQNCMFCFCPFYPCGDQSTGGYWIKKKKVWSCENCFWIHKDEVVECIHKKIRKIVKKPEDFEKKKKELLKLRRECLLKHS